MTLSATPTPTLLRLPAVCLVVGLSKSQIYKLIRRGAFPAPVSLGCSAVAWPASDVHKWIAEKIGRQGCA
ncbi:prophage regulatory protein [Pseudomonas sp. JAI115]|uniref:helix-turn-helix transcriptional regulator n=1 Tax=Pseudomonas sp. JAI115 TaxID=2723061 RepID=UPI00160FA1A4|nr:AlpA family transcriptional regulator [Pseudomonas sp. JAI115]MBB6155903.1 prophage regulatory protein [Pseudomonas sp. JAI115]